MSCPISSRPGILSCFAVAAVFAGALVHAQLISSSIVGVVTDSSGAPVGGVAITVKNAETGAVNKAVTDTAGSYSVPALLAGVYEVTAAKSGFQSYTAKGVQSARPKPARPEYDASESCPSIRDCLHLLAASSGWASSASNYRFHRCGCTASPASTFRTSSKRPPKGAA